MNVTITLTDEQIDAIKEALRVRKEDYDNLVRPTNVLHDYAARIMTVRQCLDLRLDYSASCYDYQGEGA